MNAITYFKLKSPYEGDVTKNCALTGSEVDNNFYTLEGRDIKSLELVDDKIVINLINGDKLTTDKLTEDCVKGLEVSFDELNGILTITHNGITKTISGFATNYEVTPAIAVDGSLIGNGLPETPVGISPVFKTGQYRPVKCIIDKTKNEKLPSQEQRMPNDRFLTIENINDYGYLYNYNGLRKIACKLREIDSEWRIPTKQDWDNMLDAIEPFEEGKNHTDMRSNQYLGMFAGKFLKSKVGWKKDPNETETEDETCFDYNDEPVSECTCGHNTQCHPNYCGEYGHCRHKCKSHCKGIDKYCFGVLPAGCATDSLDYLYFTDRAYFWTASNHDYRDAYMKAFVYNKCNVLQDILAGDNYLSVRLVKDFNGTNYHDTEDILGSTYSTVLMPSTTQGRAIWTSVNLSISECECDCHNTDYVLPNNGEGMGYTKKYFINEWDGKNWLKKQIHDGESVVVINEVVDDTYMPTYHEYRLVNGELVDVSTVIFNEVMEAINPEIEDIKSDITEVDEKLNGEIERSEQKDSEHDEAINNLNGRMANAEEKIEQNIQDIQDIKEHITQTDSQIEELNNAIEEEKQIRAQKDEELEDEIEAERQERVADVEALMEEDALINNKITALQENLENEKNERIEKDNEIDSQLIIKEGTEFNSENGILTLKTKGGVNDIQTQFSFNFGNF